MTDLVERLRERVASPFERPAVDQALMSEAATALSEAKAENERLREALGFYSQQWVGGHDRFWEPSYQLLQDCGVKARAALTPKQAMDDAIAKGGDNGETR